MKYRLQAHDLLRLRFPFPPETGNLFDRTIPGWAGRFLTETPWVVVRREKAESGIPVGIRGNSKQQRFGCVLHIRSTPPEGSITPKPVFPVEEIRTPEQIFQGLLQDYKAGKRKENGPWSGWEEELLKLTEMSWYKKEVSSVGIGGSAGFELASGRKVTSPESDLDLLFTVTRNCTKELCREIFESLQVLPVRTDAVLVTDRGFTSLDEYVHSSGRFLIKTAEGCCLAEDLWQEEQVKKETREDENSVYLYRTGISASGDASRTPGPSCIRRIPAEDGGHTGMQH